MTTVPVSLTSDMIAAALHQLRQNAPKVHCVTNTVAQYFTANVVLAIGAVPSMTIAVDEVEGFATNADALLVNLGTLDDTRRVAIPKAMRAARDAGRPVVLDPVKVHRSKVRCEFAVGLLAEKPTLLRANEDELGALFPGGATFGDMADKDRTLAMSGRQDLIGDGQKCLRLDNGHPLLAQVTATGCAGGAVMAAFLTVEPDPVLAAAMGLSVFNIAGEIAAERARGPGSLVPELLDALYLLDADQLDGRLKLSDLQEGTGS
ncbi:hydroxyethylthiazole kinase [Roseibium algae]|uniref:Hydroxyethylthiazole kinase n=1 Tax=Roseibium algae TaxID=3123038 RepID=A0ABU8TKX6_9HYPH